MTSAELIGEGDSKLGGEATGDGDGNGNDNDGEDDDMPDEVGEVAGMVGGALSKCCELVD